MTAGESKARQPLLWTLWHPHQHLWNWRLEAVARRAGRPVGAGSAFVRVVVALDSLLLYLRVVVARVVRFGPSAFRRASPSGRTVLYVDCGLHREGAQVRAVAEQLASRCDLRVLAFEASAEHHAEAVRNLADLGAGARLDLRQVALVGPANDADTVKLYKGAHGGRADSLFRPGDTFEVVPAERLSAILRRDYGDVLRDAPLLLRMNIEGSEYDVVDDLVTSAMASRVDGWFGMWDDVSKIDPDKDRRFRHMLRTAGIRNITFNDRDLPHPLRRRAIALAIDSALRSGLRRRTSPDSPGPA